MVMRNPEPRSYGLNDVAPRSAVQGARRPDAPRAVRAAVPRWRGDGRRVDRGCRHFAACGVQTSRHTQAGGAGVRPARRPPDALQRAATRARAAVRSEEHTSELPSLIAI